MSNLKPCPFCGSEDVQAQGCENFAVICKDCGANGPLVSGESIDKGFSEARRQWNEREELTVRRFSSNAAVIYSMREMTKEEAVLLGIKKGKEDAE